MKRLFKNLWRSEARTIPRKPPLRVASLEDRVVPASPPLDLPGHPLANPAVLFAPYNEPHFENDQPSDADFAKWRDGGTIDETGEFAGRYHSPGMQGLVNTIRAAGANNVIAPEGLNWGSNLSGVLTGH